MEEEQPLDDQAEQPSEERAEELIEELVGQTVFLPTQSMQRRRTTKLISKLPPPKSEKVT